MPAVFLRESCRRRRRRGFFLKQTLSVTALPCHLPRRGRLWQGQKVFRLSADFFLPLTGEDETCRFCQGLPLSGELSSAARLRGFVPDHLLQSRAAHTYYNALQDAEDETCRFCQGLPLSGELSSAARLRGFVPDHLLQSRAAHTYYNALQDAHPDHGRDSGKFFGQLDIHCAEQRIPIIMPYKMRTRITAGIAESFSASWTFTAPVASSIV